MPYKNREERLKKSATYQREVWYPLNKKKHIQTVKRRLIKYIEEFQLYKAEKGCKDCGEKDFRCLDFHHLQGKNFNIGSAVRLGYGRDKLFKEISKCIVVCANCHRKRHYVKSKYSTRVDLVIREAS